MSVPRIQDKLDSCSIRVVTLRIGERSMTSTNATELPERPAVPIELSGKWIAWTFDGTRIVAHGDTLDECEEAADKAGEKDPRFEKTPRADVRIVGAAR